MLKLHKETKVDIRPNTPDSIVHIPIQSHGFTKRRAKFSISTSTSFYEDAAQDEDAFAKRFLATQGSVYFRKRKTYPRCYLWRVVGDDRSLELRSTDLIKSVHEDHEANLTLRFEFEDSIIPNGVALADSEDHEALSVFVLTSSRQLHTFTLRPEYFRRATLIDENIVDWCKICQPAPLNFAHPHRLHASNPFDLFISLDTGALLRLSRKPGEDGSNWSPITFDERTWSSSLRGLVRWNNYHPIRYGDRSLDPNTPNAIATSSDQTFAFAVGLNHSLKVWDLVSQSLVASKDLLDRTSQEQSASPVTLNPAESTFIRVFNAERATEDDMYYVVTYSPHEDGQFKFWAVKTGDTSHEFIEDLFPHDKLKPMDPDPSGSVFWVVADFQIKSMDEGRQMALWVLWRSHNFYQLHNLHFDLTGLPNSWNKDWTMTAFELHRNEPPPKISQFDVTDTTEKWLRYIFSPGKYSTDVLETSLLIFRVGVKLNQLPSKNKQFSTLQQRVCTAITDSVTLRKLPDAELSFSKYHRDIEGRWQQFWQIAEDITKKTNEVISLAYDSYFDLPWLMFTGGCALVRECSSTELLLHNEAIALRENFGTVEGCWPHRSLIRELGEHPDKSACLVSVAAAFRTMFTSSLHQACSNALNDELFVESSLSAAERIANFHQKCGFAELITEEIFDAACASIENSVGYKGLNTELFFAVVDTLPLGFPGKDSELQSTDFGLDANIQGTMEILWLSRQIIYDLLMLALFVETELAPEEDNLQFDGIVVFTTLVDLLKEYEMMIWLGSNTRVRPEKHQRSFTQEDSILSVSKDLAKGGRPSTILEDLFAAHIKPRPAVGMSHMFTLTQQIRDIISWITRQGEVSLPNVLVFIQCDLLACGHLDLASDFLRFQPNTAWSTYAKGRLYLAKSEFDVAAVYFQKAAYLLSYGKAVGNLHEMSSNLLDIVSVDSFYNGLPRYLQHVASLFEHSRAFTHVVDFAGLALQALEPTLKKSEPNVDSTKLRSDILSRLFHASLNTCNFDDAYSALSRYTDLALQKSALTSLVTTIFSTSGPGTTGLQKLLRLPLSLAPHLSSHIDEILLSLANKQMPVDASLSQLTSRIGWDDRADTVDYNHILKAYRIASNDFRGAAEISYQTVYRLRGLRDRPSYFGQKIPPSQDIDQDDIESKELRNELVSLINLLASLEESEAYIVFQPDKPRNALQRNEDKNVQKTGPADPFVVAGAALDNIPESNSTRSAPTLNGERLLIPNDPPPGRRDSASFISATSPTLETQGQEGQPLRPQKEQQPSHAKRIVITLDDLRREYQMELDRVSRIESGNWEFGASTGLEKDNGSFETGAMDTL